MNSFSIERSLADMRIMRDEARGLNVAQPQGPFDFAALLKSSLDQVNGVQLEAGNMQSAFESGDTRHSLAQVMIASQKADVAFQGAVQVRNKLVEAYKDVMNMSM